MASIREISTKRGRGFQIDYYDINGNRKRKSVYCSKRKAQNIAKSLEWKKANVELGLESLVNDHIALGKVVIQYLAVVEYQKKELTIKRERIVYNSFQAYVGRNVAIGLINRKNIESYLLKRQKKDNLKPDTIHIEIRTLKQFFQFLVDHDNLIKNPVKGIKGPKRKSKKIQYLSIKDVRKLLKVIDDQEYKDLVTTYIYTGARRSEILAPNLTWDDVDFSGRKIRIHGKMDKIAYIPMNDAVNKILLRRKETEGHDYPFEFDYHYMYKKIKKYLDAAGFDWATIHTFRKTFGSILVQSGVDIYRVSKLCRHSSVTVTQKHYAELLDKNLSDSVAILNKVLNI